MGSLECQSAWPPRWRAQDRVYSTVRNPALFCRLSVLFPKWKRVFAFGLQHLVSFNSFPILRPVRERWLGNP